MQLIIFIAVSVSIFSKLNTDGKHPSRLTYANSLHEVVFPAKINGAVLFGINIPAGQVYCPLLW